MEFTQVLIKTCVLKMPYCFAGGVANMKHVKRKYD